VLALAQSGNTVYLGGEFANLGGQPRLFAAATDAVTGAVLPWNPDIGGSFPGETGFVHTITPSTNAIFLGGDFTDVRVAPGAAYIVGVSP
jgi:hypothetical protein